MKKRYPKENDIIRAICNCQHGTREVIGRVKGYKINHMGHYVVIGDEDIYMEGIADWEILKCGKENNE